MSLGIFAAAFSVSLPATPTEAAAQAGFYIYEFDYFSDATLTTQVGYARQACAPGAGNSSWGIATPYKTSNVIGWCNSGGGGHYY